eukprot:6040352-Pyramimonas_sp.AAC.1
MSEEGERAGGAWSKEERGGGAKRRMMMRRREQGDKAMHSSHGWTPIGILASTRSGEIWEASIPHACN